MRLLLLAGAALAELSLVFDRTPTSVPPGWKSVGPASPNDVLSVELHMYQRNRQELDRVFAAVSDPRSTEYQNFRTQDEINTLLAPPCLRMWRAFTSGLQLETLLRLKCPTWATA